MPFARRALDVEILTQPGDLAGNPPGIPGVPEPRVVYHRAEHVHIGGLSLQIDRQFLQARAAGVLVAPCIVEGAQQRRRAGRVDDGAELTDTIREYVLPPL